MILPLAIILFLALFIFYWQGSSKPIEVAANKFVAPASWKIDRNEIHPPSIICWNGYACPSVWRGWHVPSSVTFGQIIKFAKSTNINMRVNKSCTAVSNTVIEKSPCTFYGKDGHYSYTILVSIPSDHNTSHVYLGIESVHSHED